MSRDIMPWRHNATWRHTITLWRNTMTSFSKNTGKEGTAREGPSTLRRFHWLIVSHWVSSNSCTCWVPGYHKINERLSPQTIGGSPGCRSCGFHINNGQCAGQVPVVFLVKLWVTWCSKGTWECTRGIICSAKVPLLIYRSSYPPYPMAQSYDQTGAGISAKNVFCGGNLGSFPISEGAI